MPETFEIKLKAITFGAEASKTNKLKYLIDTGNEISIISGSSLKSGVNCSPEE
jgi:hypothetical protein